MATRPDSNVRPARCRTAESAAAARRFALARLLLGIALKLFLFAAISSSMPACIIPVGPSWQDPPGDPDSQPQIEEPNPDILTVVTANPATNSRDFAFTVTDPNPADSLFLRLVVDDQHRGFSNSADMLPSPGDGSLIRKRVVASVDCTFVDPNLMSHLVKVGVADKEFSDDPKQLLSLRDPSAGKVVLIGWWLTLNCQPSAGP